MSVEHLIRRLTSQGVRLEPRGDRLHVEAPEGALSDTDLAAIRIGKPDILRLLGGAQLPAPAVSIDAALAQTAALRDAWRKVCRELGETCGWPRLSYKPGHAVSPGEANWSKYVSRASVPDLVCVMVALQGVLETLPHALDPDGHPPA